MGTIALASELTSKIWGCILKSNFFDATSFSHYPGVVSFVGDICDTHSQDSFFTKQVTLAGKDSFDRVESALILKAEYSSFARTRIYENIHLENLDPSKSIFQIVSAQLLRLSRRQLFCSYFLSNENDYGVGLHSDAWHGAIIQTNGAKKWYIHDDKNKPHELILQCGDALLVPMGLTHRVETPVHSEHVLFGFLDTRID